MKVRNLRHNLRRLRYWSSV